MSIPSAIETRKLDHIAINLERNVEVSGLTTGFERLQFINNALPEIDLDAVDTSVDFLGKPLSGTVSDFFDDRGSRARLGDHPESGRRSTRVRVRYRGWIATGGSRR